MPNNPPIPFGSALPINVKAPIHHAANGSCVFTCSCGMGPMMIGSYDSAVVCTGCHTLWQIQEAHMRRTPEGVEVLVKLGHTQAPATRPM